MTTQKTVARRKLSLLDRLPGPRGPHPNRVSAAIEQAVLDHALAHPCHGPMRVAQELVLGGLQVSSGGVRGVWQRHGLLTKRPTAAPGEGHRRAHAHPLRRADPSARAL